MGVPTMFYIVVGDSYVDIGNSLASAKELADENGAGDYTIFGMTYDPGFCLVGVYSYNVVGG